MFDTVLVADRGVLARRVVRTCHRLGARAVTVHSAADAGAPHTADADESVLLGAPDPATSYLDGRKVLEAAGQCAAQAIHPGGSALAASAAFAASVRDAGLAWVGAPVEALEAVAARPAAPALVGGRRIAVQLLGLDRGRTVAIADYERRHGVVECPTGDLSAAARAAAHEAAVAVGASVGLVGPASVEVALDHVEATAVGVMLHLGRDHPVVELVTGVDLVEHQLLVASGSPAPYDEQDRPGGVGLQVELRARTPRQLWTWRPPGGEGVRVEAGYSEGEQTSPYDDLVATVAVWGADRDEARDRLRAALADCVLDGVDLRDPPEQR